MKQNGSNSVSGGNANNISGNGSNSNNGNNRNNNTPLKLINMADVKSEQVNFLWKPYIAYGKITIVQGDPGEGKTSMMLAIAASVTRGESIITGITGEEDDNNSAALCDSVLCNAAICNSTLCNPAFPPSLSPSNVIFQTAEDGLADTIKPRLEQLNADYSRVDVIDETDKTLSLLDERIEQAILETNAKLLILDPLQAYMGNINMNRANSVRPLMKKIANVAESTGAAIVIIGHLNKDNGSSGKSIYRGLGSIDIPAAARSVLTVGRLKHIDENMRAFIQTKSNLAPAGKPQAFGFDPTSGFCWLGDCDVTIDELLDNKKKTDKGASQLDMAKAFIKGLMAKGDVLSSDVFDKGSEAGFPEITMKRAKSELNIKSVKRGNEWFWVTEPNQGYQGYQRTQHSENAQEISDSAESRSICEVAPARELCAARVKTENSDALDTFDTLAPISPETKITPVGETKVP